MASVNIIHKETNVNIQRIKKKAYGLIAWAKTDSLIIRPYKIKDIKLFYKYTKDKEMTKYLTCGNNRTYEQAAKFVTGAMRLNEINNETRFVIADKDTDKLVGAISVYFGENSDKIELGYWIGKEHWGNGYITSAIKEIIERLRVITEIKEAYLEIIIGNKASIRAAEKAGFVHDGELPVIKQGKSIITMRLKMN